MIDITAIKDQYKTFSESNPGCSMETAIVLDKSEDYVPQEYDIVEMLLNYRSDELMYFDFTHQELLYDKGRSFDCLTVNVVWCDRSESKIFSTEEKYWFDISENFKFGES